MFQTGADAIEKYFGIYATSIDGEQQSVVMTFSIPRHETFSVCLGIGALELSSYIMRVGKPLLHSPAVISMILSLQRETPRVQAYLLKYLSSRCSRRDLIHSRRRRRW